MEQTLFTELTVGCYEERLFAFMKSLGLKKIDVVYSGGGDSGGMDNMEFHPNVLSQEQEQKLKEKLEEELSGPIYSRHGSFADGGGYYVHGLVRYDAENHTVAIMGTDHITEYEGDYDEETGEYEHENESETDWEEVVYERDSMKYTQEDYEFAVLYSIVKGEKLPEEYHNRLLAAATNGDEDAEEYIKSLKINK